MSPILPSPNDRRLTGAWDALRRPIWMFDPHRLCGVYANPPALKLWGADSLDELLARDFSKLSPAARARTERMAMATRAGEQVVERWTFYPNGKPVTVQATISAFRLEDGREVLLFEASPLEIEAEERRAVEALRHTSTLITLFDSEGRHVFSNPAAFNAYGLDPPPLQARFQDPEKAQAFLSQTHADEGVADVCEMVTLQGRRWRHLDLRTVLDPVTGAPGLLLNEIDVTRQVQAEQAWAAAEQKAAMAQARQRFLTEMSHDLKTPLNAVIGFSTLLMDGGGAPDQVEQAGRINESGKRLLHVVEEMISLSECADETTTAPSPPRLTAMDPAPGGPPLTPTAEGPSLRVLYVDDNAHNRVLVRTLLSTQGIDCQTADDGRQGVEAAAAHRWNLILMDIQMPVMDGIEAARAIRAAEPATETVPIIALTANTLPKQVDAYYAAGMNDCVSKPIDFGDLLDKVSYWSDAARHGAALFTARA